MDRHLLEQDLDEFVEGESWPEAIGDEDDAPPRPAANDEEAQKILRRLKRLDRQAAGINAVADADIGRINAWRSDRIAGVEREVAWGRRSLEAFARRVIPGSGRRSVPLPDGTLKLTGPGKGKVEIDDADKIIAWATEHDLVSSDPDKPLAVNLKPTPSKTEIGKYATGDKIAVTLDDEGAECNVHAIIGPDGNPIPGVSRVIRAGDAFNMTLGED